MNRPISRFHCANPLDVVITQQTDPSAITELLTTPGSPMISGDCAAWHNVIAAFQQGATRAIDSKLAFIEPTAARGITIVGGGKYLPSVYVTVRVLRHVGCTLPIEVWHFDGENDPTIEDAIREYDVTFHNACHVQQQHRFRFLADHWWRGWQLKAFALLHSRFESTLLLDADNYPTRDPEYLFDWPEYKQHGAVIWPDQENSPTVMNQVVCDLFEIEPPNVLTAESGQLLINRRQCWRQLRLAGFYNQASDVAYRHIWGDKDTFPIAFFRSQTQFARMWPVCRVIPDCILQYDFNGRVIFQHRCGDKFKLSLEAFHSTPQRNTENFYNPSLAHEAFCFSVLDELRSIVSSMNPSTV